MDSPLPPTPYTLLISHLGDAAFLGHRDRTRGLTRSLRRTGLPLVLTQGFHPHPRMALPEPLPVGVGSEGERFVVFFEGDVGAARIAALLADKMPAHMEVVDVRAGDLREAVDQPLLLEFRSSSGPALQELIEGLDSAEVLRLASHSCRPTPPGLECTLIPPAGQRASVGRLVRAISERSLDLARTVTSITRQQVAPLHS